MTDSTSADKCWVRTKALNVAIYGNDTSSKKARRLSGDGFEDDAIDWGWVQADVVKLKDPIQILVNDEDYTAFHGRTLELPADSFEVGNVVMGNKHAATDDFGGDAGYEDEEDSVERYPDDLITLTHLHEPAVVHCLRKRYSFDKIYTSTGPILLALNPFKNCRHLYSTKIQQQYCDRGEAIMRGDAGALDAPLEPHVYHIADNAFRDMMRAMAGDDVSIGGGDAKRRTGGGPTTDQSILVSGESGAGKTVTTKIIMQYLASLSQRGSSSQKSTKKPSKRGNGAGEGGSGGEQKNIEQQVLQSNPILESFGNARTIRNDNSSRFGKFIEIEFSQEGGSLLGASIETYLLEKVRLIRQSEGERNYHIFYEVFCMPEEELEAMHLEDYSVEDFKMTSQSGTFDRRDGVEDSSTLEDLLSAMETMGITSEEQGNVLSIAAAALHASNVTFLEVSADESTLETDNPHLIPFCNLMGITTDALDKALCYLKIRAGRDVNTRTLPRSKAEKGLEAIIKAFYGALFTFLVRRINESITVKKSNGRSTKAAGRSRGGGAKIGVLDIFGFESFKLNSFEQLCINLCNEALQQQFNLFVLKNEQAEYEREGIEWSFIQFPDNQDVLDLIDKKGSGILNILDDQCRAPGTTDKTFCIDLYKKCTAHPRFTADYRQVGAQKFAIRHYAGVVEYDTDGFVEKNRDDLPREASDLLMSSEKEIVRTLANIIRDPEAPSKDSKTVPARSPRKSGGKPTVGGQFTKQLQELRSKIDLTSPHYIRCLKPNDVLVPDHFNPLIIADQLRYAGVIEAVRVSRVGYPQRYSHSAFTSRYRILASRELKKAQRASRRAKPVNTVVNAVSAKVWRLQCQEGDKEKAGEKAAGEKAGAPPSLVAVGIQVGKTKVFLRRRAFELLEQLRLGKMTDCAVSIQTAGRRYMAHRDYLWTHQSLIRVQSWVRMRAAIQCVQELRLNVRSTTLQTRWRLYAARKQYLAMKAVAIALQKTQRGRLGRMRYAQLNQIRKAIVVQKYWKRHVCKLRFLQILQAIITVQCAARCRLARRKRTELRKKARELTNVAEERNSLREEVQSLRTQMIEMSKSLATAKAAARNTVSKEEHEANLAQVEKLSRQVSDLKSAHEASETKARAEADRANTAERTVEETKADAEDSRRVAQKAAEEQMRVAEELAAKTTELLSVQEELKSSSAALSEQVASNTSQSEEHEKEIATLRKALEVAQEGEEEKEAIRREKDDILKELEDLKEEQDCLETKRESLEAERDDLLSAKAALEAEGEELRKQQDILKQECADIKKDRDEARQSAESCQKLQKEKEDTYLAEIEKLKQECITLQEESDRKVQQAEPQNGQSTETSRDLQIVAGPELQGELEEARLEICRLEKELQEAIEKEATSSEEALQEAKAIEKTRREELEQELQELQEKAKQEALALKEEIEDLKFQLEEAADQCSDAISEEMFKLQDEVNRLTKEVAKAKCGADEDESSQMIVQRYTELKRLADAVLEKDREIEQLRTEKEDEEKKAKAEAERANAAEKDVEETKAAAEEAQKAAEDAQKAAQAAAENMMRVVTLDLSKSRDDLVAQTIELQSVQKELKSSKDALINQAVQTEVLEKDLATLRKALEDSQDEKEEMEAMRREKDDILKVVANLRQALEDAQTDIEEMETVRREKDDVMKELEDLREEHERNENEQMETLRREKDDVMKELENLREEYDSLEKKQNDLEVERDDLLSAKDTLEWNGEELRKEQDCLRKELDEIKRNRDEAIQSVASLKELQKEIENQHAGEVDKLKAECKTLRASFKREGQSEPSGIKQEHSSISNEILSTMMTDPGLEDELEEARNKIEELEDELQEAKAHQAKKDEVEQVLEELKEKAEQDTAAFNEEIEHLKFQLAQATSQGSDEVADEILSLQDEVNRLTKKLADSKFGGDDDESSEVLVQRYTELKRLADAVIEKDREIERLKIERDNQEKKAQSEAERADAAERTVEETKLAADDAQKAAEDSQKAAQAAAENLMRIVTLDLSNSRDAFTAQTIELQSVREELESSKATLANLTASTADQCKELEKEVGTLRNALDEAQKDNQEMETIRSQNFNIMEELENLRERGRNSNEEIERIPLEEDEIMDELKVLREERNSLEKRHKELEAQRDDLVSAKYDLERDWDELTTEHDALRKECDDIEKDRDEAVQRVEALEKLSKEREERYIVEIETLKSANTTLQEESSRNVDQSEPTGIKEELLLATNRELHWSTSLPDLEGELEEARAKIDQLEEALQDARANAATRKVDAPPEAKGDEDATQEEAKNEEIEQELKEMKGKAKEFQEEIEDLKMQLARATDQSGDEAAEVILNLQDEVNRLTNELAKANCGGNDDKSSEVLELEKRDEEIDNLTTTGNDVASNEETEHLKLYISELHKEVEQLRTQLQQNEDKKNSMHEKKHFGFLSRRTQETEVTADKSVTSEGNELIEDLEYEVEALKEVNEMLRKDVEQSRKKVAELEKDLTEEKERAMNELQAFAKTLEGVDDLRVAAETMSREVNRYKHEIPGNSMHCQDEVVDDDFSQIQYMEASKAIDQAKSSFETNHKDKSRPPPFWSLSMPLAVQSPPTTAEYDPGETLRVIIADKKKKRKKKRRNSAGGAGGSIVSSFF